MFEIVNTSVPKGLVAGSRGFTIVAMTQGTPEVLQSKADMLSAYAFRSTSHDESYRLENPVNYFHYILPQGEHVVGRVGACEFDYTGRTNRLAHLFLMKGHELSSGNTANLDTSKFKAEWTQEPAFLRQVERSVFTGALRAESGVLSADEIRAIAEDLEESFRKGKPRVLYFKASTAWDRTGEKLLGLFAAIISELPEEFQEKVTYSTYATNVPAGCVCNLCGIFDETPVFKLSSQSNPWVDCERQRLVNKEFLSVKSLETPIEKTTVVGGGMKSIKSGPPARRAPFAVGKPTQSPAYGADRFLKTQKKPDVGFWCAMGAIVALLVVAVCFIIRFLVSEDAKIKASNQRTEEMLRDGWLPESPAEVAAANEAEQRRRQEKEMEEARKKQEREDAAAQQEADKKRLAAKKEAEEQAKEEKAKREKERQAEKVKKAKEEEENKRRAAAEAERKRVEFMEAERLEIWEEQKLKGLKAFYYQDVVLTNSPCGFTKKYGSYMFDGEDAFKRCYDNQMILFFDTDKKITYIRLNYLVEKDVDIKKDILKGEFQKFWDEKCKRECEFKFYVDETPVVIEAKECYTLSELTKTWKTNNYLEKELKGVIKEKEDVIKSCQNKIMTANAKKDNLKEIRENLQDLKELYKGATAEKPKGNKFKDKDDKKKEKDEKRRAKEAFYEGLKNILKDQKFKDLFGAEKAESNLIKAKQQLDKLLEEADKKSGEIEKEINRLNNAIEECKETIEAKKRELKKFQETNDVKFRLRIVKKGGKQ